MIEKRPAIEPRGLTGAAFAALVQAFKDDPKYLAVYKTVGPENGGEWNVFNTLRDPHAGRGEEEKFRGGYSGSKILYDREIPEAAMTIQDVRDAITIALNT